MKERRLASKKDVILIAVLLTAAILMFLFFHSKGRGGTAVIEVNGQKLETVALDSLQVPREITVTGMDNITVEIELSKDGARFISSGCPDKVCVNTGLISHVNESAVCLPGRVSITIKGSGAADAVTY